MRMARIHIFLLLTCCALPTFTKHTFQSEEELEAFLKGDYERNASAICKMSSDANWAYSTDINNKDKQTALLEVTLASAEIKKQYWQEYFKDLNPADYESEAIQRQVKALKNLGNAALETDKLTTLTNIQNSMTNTYSTARICPYAKRDCDLPTEGLTLEPDIESIIAKSTDYDELVYVWQAWRDATGAKIRTNYKTYVDLKNEAAEANGFTDTGDQWRERYETDNFVANLDQLWLQVEPLYDELHTYVARKLKTRFGDNIDISDGLIPANILGNMWAQSWVNIEPLVRPFSDASEVDVTGAMHDQKYTVKKMFEMSDEFYQSLGLADNSVSYNDEALIEKPDDRDVLCHASAWDFCDGETFRIKMCTNIDMEDFITVHHEMGHIQYYLQYKDQPITFRGGANPGFHEAVGDTIALSVATPTHLQKIDLLKDYVDSEQSSINALMDMALERVAFLPFGLLIDKWRWDIFSGTVPEEEWNEHWWKYRKQYQKVKPPVTRTENDFDPGAKYHVAGDSQYINYFVAHILEFQLYRGLCIAAGEYDPAKRDEKPLHKCDFYRSTEAGDRLKAGLSLGSSQHWSKALKLMTGEEELDASALLDYFEPLYNYLYKENRKLTEDKLNELLEGEYADELQKLSTAQVHAEWNFATDVNNADKQAEQVAALLAVSEFEKKYWTDYFQFLDEDDYVDAQLRRKVKFLRVLGTAALDESKLSELTDTINKMTNIYSTAKICPYEKQDCNIETEGLKLEPGIETIISESTNYDELLYAWTAWRDESGAKIRDHYKTYVALSNEAAKKNDFEDNGEMWRFSFESDTLIEDMDAIWEQVKPLYENLHTYVANKLKERYGDKLDISDGKIPAHVLGNMWAQSWVNLASFLKPYPSASEVDVTKAMNDQGYTVLKMFETSNEFYMSLGLENNAISYNVSAGAMIEQPDDREVLCHASAWDFYDRENFRIKQCTDINYVDFITVHHEMGHIQYFLLYKHQPIIFRTGANPGFHEAVGDTIALSVATPTHLEKIGLLEDYTDSDESSINALLDMALERVAFLPFGLLVDKWRWDVFSGKVPEEKWNEHWWYYRELYQKVKAPRDRSENDFDPGAKFHVPGDSQYISYFVAHILEFQFYKALCIEAGQYNSTTKQPPLHKCDFYESREAGDKLRAGLKEGNSEHWADILEKLTGERKLNAEALLEYFAPLNEFLCKENGACGGALSNMSPSLFAVFLGLLSYFVVLALRTNNL